MHLLAAIVGIALLLHCRTTVLERLGTGNALLVSTQEGDHRVDVIRLNVGLTLRETHIIQVHVHCFFSRVMMMKMIRLAIE